MGQGSSHTDVSIRRGRWGFDPPGRMGRRDRWSRMQIRLTVLGPRGGQSCDVLVTAPAGTSLGTVAGALAASAGAGQPARSGPSVPLYAQGARLDHGAVLGRPPLVDGATVSLYEQTADDAPSVPSGAARLHVVGGPDAGGVHLLHGGQVRIGRSADADIPLDDPDVSRLHTAVTVEAGRVTVADLGSTNGTELDGAPVGERPVPLAPGALLRVGESTLALEHPRGEAGGTVPPPPANRPAVPDGEGHLQVSAPSVAGPPPAAPTAATVPATGGVPAPPEGPETPGTRARALARRLAPGRSRAGARAERSRERDRLAAEAAALRSRWPDPSELLLTALGPGPRLWERDAGHRDALSVRLGTADLSAGPDREAGAGAGADGDAVLPSAPVTVDLRRSGPLGIAGPRPRLSGLARSVVAQLCALHGPGTLEIVLVSADRERQAEQRAREWSWLRWLPQLRPSHGQDCRLLLGLDRDQAGARLSELARRVEHGPLGPSWASASPRSVAEAAARHTGPFTVLVLDGRPDAPGADETVARLLAAGPSAGIHTVCLAESRDRLPGGCSTVALLGGDVATELLVEYPAAIPRTTGHTPGDHDPGARSGRVTAGPPTTGGDGPGALDPTSTDPTGADEGSTDTDVGLRTGKAGRGAGAGRAAGSPSADDGRSMQTRVSRITAEQIAAAGARAGRAAAAQAAAGSAPAGADPGTQITAGHVTVDAVGDAWAERFARALAPLREAEAPRPRSALPETARLLDGLDLALATPSKVSARWAELPATGGSTATVLGAAAEGRCTVDLAQDGPHLLVGGAPGSGKTELLRSVAASLAAADRPDRLALVLVDGAGDRGEGLRSCTDLPHVSTYLCAADPVRLRELAQALTTELTRREELLDGRDFAAWQADRLLAMSRVISPRRAPGQESRRKPSEQGAVRTQVRQEVPPARLVVVVDDFDALVSPALGSPARQSAGSMVRALDAVARRGPRLGVHLVTATGRPERTSGGEVDELSPLRVALRTNDPVSSRLLVHVEDAAALDEAVPGRGYLRRRDGSVTPFQAGRVSGRIPRTATLRPTVVPLEWERMGDPPTRRPVRELGNGPTDLALLASALQRAAQSAEADPVPPLIP